MQRLMARSNEHHGPEEILERRGSELTEQLRQITFLKPDEKPEEIGGGGYQYFPEEVEVQEGEEATETATGWKGKRGAIWADGFRLEDAEVGAACVVERGRTSSAGGWEGAQGHTRRTTNGGVGGRLFAQERTSKFPMPSCTISTGQWKPSRTG